MHRVMIKVKLFSKLNMDWQSVSALENHNNIGVQFHPEKVINKGKNFLEIL